MISAAARSEAWVCGLSLSGIAGSTAPGIMDVSLFVSCVCCEVEVSASD